jgi:AMMECR1 domain-containing protein
VLLKLFHKVTREEMLQNLFYKANYYPDKKLDKVTTITTKRKL